jgi:predicted alpha/beta hydrolase
MSSQTSKLGFLGLLLLGNICLAAEIKQLPKQLAEPAEVIGRGLASKADELLKGEIKKYARENIFGGITGDVKPAGSVGFQRVGRSTIDGRDAVTFQFEVHARAKVDVGPGGFERKVWAVDTRQTVQVHVLPKRRDDGSVVAEVRTEIISATATKERQAKQAEADGFRDRVSKEIRSQLEKFSGEHNLAGLIGG